MLTPKQRFPARDEAFAEKTAQIIQNIEERVALSDLLRTHLQTLNFELFSDVVDLLETETRHDVERLGINARG